MTQYKKLTSERSLCFLMVIQTWHYPIHPHRSLFNLLIYSSTTVGSSIVRALGSLLINIVLNTFTILHFYKSGKWHTVYSTQPGKPLKTHRSGSYHRIIHKASTSVKSQKDFFFSTGGQVTTQVKTAQHNEITSTSKYSISADFKN